MKNNAELMISGTVSDDIAPTAPTMKVTCKKSQLVFWSICVYVLPHTVGVALDDRAAEHRKRRISSAFFIAFLRKIVYN